jgi:hypothetical protein
MGESMGRNCDFSLFGRPYLTAGIKMQKRNDYAPGLWYSPEARALTHRFQFPLLKTQLSIRSPNEKELVFEKPGHKKWVDKLLRV